MNYESKPTSELRAGDIVNCHGMRCLIDAEPTNKGARIGTYWTRALVLNRNDVPSRVVPFGWTLENDGSHRWTIQGNNLARWSVETGA